MEDIFCEFPGQNSLSCAYYSYAASYRIHCPRFRNSQRDACVGKSPIVAHNMAFDYSVWRAHTELGNLPDFSNPRLCTLRMARYQLQRPTGTNGLENLIHDYCPGLAFAHHDASEDARVTGELFLAMLRHLEMPLGQFVETFALTQAPRQRGSLGSGSGSGTRPVPAPCKYFNTPARISTPE